MGALPSRTERRDGTAYAAGDVPVRVRPRSRPHVSMDGTEDLQRLLADLATLVAGVTVAAREFGRVSARVRGAVADLGDAVGDAWGVAREHGGGAWRVAERAVASRPYVAIGLAAVLVAAAGFAASRTLRAPGSHDGSHDDADGWDHFV